MSQPEHITQLADHLFRHESGRMVAVLTKIFGTENLELAEDVVQDTLLLALQTWKLKGVPENPSGWLFRVAKNKAIDVIRKNKYSVDFDFNDPERLLLKSEYTLTTTMENLFKEELIKDDLLRMMFACCHPEISEENQITLILKTLCGFSTAEIAKAFLTSEDTVSKRLYRTKEFFRERKIRPAIPSVNELQKRIDVVLNSIYLLFNEGYNSTNSEELIRKDVIEQAMMLCKLMTENEHTQVPQVYALMALMCFHASRSDSRLTKEGEIILLPKQDRSKWNYELINEGNNYMNKAAFGNSLSAYHIEAAIAFEHCSAASYGDTNWKRILEYYSWLCKIAPTHVTLLNKAVAVLQINGAKAALNELENIADQKKLESYYLYHSLLGDIYFMLNNSAKAKSSLRKAMELTKSETEKKFIREKIYQIEN
ncbi:MAG: sigma-70 family RNA polymerase sigma factor [Bacteroidia bacterium]